MTSGIIDPVAFNLGPLTVMWYGVIIAIGIVLALWLAGKEADRLGFEEDYILDAALWVVPIGFIGARLYYVLFELDYYLANPTHIIAIWEGGLAIYGGVIAGALVIIWYTKKTKKPLWLTLDVVAPSLMIAQAIGRWGNFVNQEAHGGPVSLAFLQKLHLPEFIIEQMHIDGAYYHPTFLYESLWNLLGFVLIMLFRHKEGLFKRGEIALSYVAWYAFGRFFIEGMRTDSLYLFNSPIRISQALSFVLFFVAIALIIYRRRTIFPQYAYTDGLAPEKKKSKEEENND